MTRGRDAGLYAAGLLFQQGVSFVAGVAAARCLGPHGLGEAGTARALAGLLAIVAPLGLDLSLLRHFGRAGAGAGGSGLADRWGEVTALRRRVALVNATAVLALATLAGPWLQAHVWRQPAFALDFALALAALPFTADLAVLTAACRAFDRVAAASLCTLFLQPVLRTALLAVLLGAGAGAAGLLAATALGVAGADLALARRLRPERPAGAAGAPVPAGLFGYSGWMAAMLLAYGGFKLMDVLVLARARPAGEVGDYCAFASFAQLIGLLPTALSQALGPHVAALYAEGRREAARAALAAYVRRAGLACAPLMAGLAVFGPWLDLLFGGRFRFPPGLCWALAGGAYVGGVFGPLSVSLSMTGRHRSEFAILCAGALAALGAALALAPALGGTGVALAMLGGYVLVNGGRTALSARVMGGLDIGLADLQAPGACILVALLVRGAAGRWGGHDWPTAIAAAAALLVLDGGLYAGWLLAPAERARLLAPLSRRRWRSAAA